MPRGNLAVRGGRGGRGGRGSGELPPGAIYVKGQRGVTIVKETAATKTGLTLGGDEALPPAILGVSPNGVAAAKVVVGERLLAVNGVAVTGHDAASQLLRAATGEVLLLVAPADAESTRAVREATQPASQRPSPPTGAMQSLLLAQTRPPPPPGNGVGGAKAAAAPVECRFGTKCTRPLCKYAHPAANGGQSTTECRFGAKCSRPQCKYVHSTGRAPDGKGAASAMVGSAMVLVTGVADGCAASGLVLQGDRLLAINGARVTDELQAR